MRFENGDARAAFCQSARGGKARESRAENRHVHSLGKRPRLDARHFDGCEPEIFLLNGHSLFSLWKNTSLLWKFTLGAMRFIDRCVGVRARRGIGIRNRDPAKRRAPQNVRPRPRRKVAIRIPVVFIGVTVAPAIRGDSGDVARRVKSCGTEHALQLFACIEFDFLERCGLQFVTARAVLIAPRRARAAWRSQEEKHSRFFRPAWKFVVAYTDGKIERDKRVIASRRNYLMDAKLRERFPISDCDTRIKKRRLYAIR